MTLTPVRGTHLFPRGYGLFPGGTHQPLGPHTRSLPPLHRAAPTGPLRFDPRTPNGLARSLQAPRREPPFFSGLRDVHAYLPCHDTLDSINDIWGHAGCGSRRGLARGAETPGQGRRCSPSTAVPRTSTSQTIRRPTSRPPKRSGWPRCTLLTQAPASPRSAGCPESTSAPGACGAAHRR